MLAARLLQIARVVLGAQGDHLFRTVQKVGGDLGGKRCLAAFMGADEMTVDPHHGPVVDGSEVEEQPVSALLRRQNDNPPVPHHRVKARVVNA